MNKSFTLKITSFVAMMLLSQFAMAKAVGSVTFATGDVTIAHADNTTTKATKNADLSAGDAIETKEGRVQLSMIDGGKISLQPNTIYKINQFEFTGKEDGSEYNFTELVKGGLRTVSGLIGHKNRDHYQLKTAVATIGIRGTEFTVNFNDNSLLMTTNHGSVDVCNAGGCLNAITGQSIQVVGIGGAPKPSNKAAKAAAAPPPAGKAVFAAGEQINTAALTTTLAAVTITPAIAPTVGNDTIVSLATMPVGVVSNNGVYKGTATFTGNNLISYVDNSGTPNIVTGTILEANSDAFLKWGRASGGTYNGQPMLMTNWITGIATPSAVISALNSTGVTGSYLVANSTTPYLVSSSGTITTGNTDTVTGGLSLNFSTYKLSYNLNIPIASNIVSITGLNVSLAAASAKFSDNNAIITGTGFCGCTTTGSGILSNNAYVEGSLFGPNAERAGLQYGVQVSGSGLPGGGGNLFGGVVLNK